jgi:hypothetical protein
MASSGIKVSESLSERQTSRRRGSSDRALA